MPTLDIRLRNGNFILQMRKARMSITDMRALCERDFEKLSLSGFYFA